MGELRKSDEVLYKLLEKSIKEMTWKIYGKYSRKKVIEKERIKIEWGKLEHPLAGTCEKIGDYKDGYKIVIGSFYDWTKYGASKKWFKNRVAEIINHELLHAHVEDWKMNDESWDDAHPTFLAHCRYLKIRNGHKEYALFCKSKRALEVDKCTDYWQLLALCCKYERELDDLKIDEKNKIVSLFRYSTEAKCGMKAANVSQHDGGITGVIWDVGGNLDKDQIKRIYNKKIERLSRG